MLKKVSLFFERNSELQSSLDNKKSGDYISKNSRDYRDQLLPGQVSHKLQKQKNIHEGLDFLSLIRAWKDICGEKLAEHTIPLKNKNGVLIILSNHSLFATELKFMEPILKKKIFSLFPKFKDYIKSIHFIVDSTHFDQQVQVFKNEIQPEKVELPHPYSPEYKKLTLEAKKLLSEVNDPETLELLSSIYRQICFNKS